MVFMHKNKLQYLTILYKFLKNPKNLIDTFQYLR